jgi:hypothetical protein
MFAPRFLLPRCGVAVWALGVFPRFVLLAGWIDALRCRLAEPLTPPGVVRTGVRREDRWGGREACFAGRAPTPPKSKPKDACTEDGLAVSVRECEYPCQVVKPTLHPERAAGGVRAGLVVCQQKFPRSYSQSSSVPMGAIAMGGVTIARSDGSLSRVGAAPLL